MFVPSQRTWRGTWVNQRDQGSYPPNTQEKPIYEKKCKASGEDADSAEHVLIMLVASDEAPTGMMARGHYDAISKFVDDDDQTHLKFEWSFDITKDWK